MKTGTDGEPERLLSRIASVALALVIAPVVGVVGGVAWSETADKNSGTLAALILGIAVFALLVWKGSPLLQRLFQAAGASLPEPVASSLLFGVIGAILPGGGMAALILVLGHTRPEGWDFDRIPIWMGAGFVVFAVIGFVIGRLRQRARNDGLRSR